MAFKILFAVFSMSNKMFIGAENEFQISFHDFFNQFRTSLVKVPILKEVNFGKVKLWDVEHFWTLFVFTFGRDCYCIQQSRPKMKTKSVQKCSTCQSFTFPKWHSFKIGTLVLSLGIWGSEKRKKYINSQCMHYYFKLSWNQNEGSE